MPREIRNVAIIAHVDHGKTSLVDCLLTQSGTLGKKDEDTQCVLDSNDLERERGITILAKNTAIQWEGTHINIVDTPGHADFGGEVERILSMVDSVLLVVDAVDGPMPQTRFVTRKAFAQKLSPIVIINKIDREGARPDWVIERIFDMFDDLGASDEQLDFPVIYTSAIQGYATLDPENRTESMKDLFEAIVNKVPPPNAEVDGPFQMQISSLDYSSYVGTIGIGRVHRGSVKPGQDVKVTHSKHGTRNARVMQVLQQIGLSRFEQKEALAGDIIAITGIDPLHISDTVCEKTHVEALPELTVDEPTLSMTFQVNTSPFAGKEGKFVTSRQIRARLDQELIHNVALKVEDTGHADKFKVSGRGELHLSILIETMRREGYELALSKPQVITRVDESGQTLEPYEHLTIDVEETHQGSIMEQMGVRKGELVDMAPSGRNRVRLDYHIPTRGLIGFQSEFLTITSGTGIMTFVFHHWGPLCKEALQGRKRGALISNSNGASTGFSLFNMQARGKLMIGPGVDVYEGMLVGFHTRDNDLVVNVVKGKQLTNVRASGTDENIQLTPPLKLTLEQSLEAMNNDELVEVTPESIRMRKKYLLEHERKKAKRED